MADSKLVSEVALSALASDIKAALALKANQATTYTKTETDNLLADKADKSDTYTKEETDNEVYNVLPTDTASGSIATFSDGGDNIPVKSFECEIVAQQASGTPTPSDPLPITGFSQADITVTDNDQISNIYTVAFGQTIYGGRLIYSNGAWAIEATHGFATYDGTEYWSFQVTSGVNTFRLSKPNDSTSGINNKSNILPSASSQAVANNTFYFGIANMVFATNDISSLSDWQTLLANNSLQIVYELATPVIIPLTSSTRVKTISGVNNIFSNTGDCELEYRADIGLYIDKKLNP